MPDVYEQFLREVAPQWDVPATLYTRAKGHDTWIRVCDFADPYEGIMPFAVLARTEAMLVMYGDMVAIGEQDGSRVRVMLYSNDNSEAVVATQHLGGAITLFGPGAEEGAGGLFSEALDQARFLLAVFPKLAQGGLFPKGEDND